MCQHQSEGSLKRSHGTSSGGDLSLSLIKRMVCISSRSQGGLGMPHLPSRLAAVHLQTVLRLFDSNNHWLEEPGHCRNRFCEWAVQHIGGPFLQDMMTILFSGIRVRLCLFRSSDPLQLQEATTQEIYRRIVKAKVESPVSLDSWSALWTLSVG